MKSLDQIKKENPQLKDLSDDELRAIRADVYVLARLMVEWWVEQQLGSKAISLGLLKSPDGLGYDNPEE